MYQLNLLLVHVEPQARSSRAWFWSPTDRQSFFILPAFLGFYYEHFTIFWENYFCISQNKKFQNPTSLFFK